MPVPAKRDGVSAGGIPWRPRVQPKAESRDTVIAESETQSQSWSQSHWHWQSWEYYRTTSPHSAKNVDWVYLFSNGRTRSKMTCSSTYHRWILRAKIRESIKLEVNLPHHGLSGVGYLTKLTTRWKTKKYDVTMAEQGTCYVVISYLTNPVKYDVFRTTPPSCNQRDLCGTLFVAVSESRIGQRIVHQVEGDSSWASDFE